MTTCHVFGIGGYLADAFLSTQTKLSTFAMSRDQLPTKEGVYIDFSFPTNFSDEETMEKYIETILSRCLMCKELNSRYIYIGSMSSIHRASSNYGRRKAEVEDGVKRNGGIILRLGLILDWQNPGGRFKEFLDQLENLPALISPSKDTFELWTMPLSLAFESINSIVVAGTKKNDYVARGVFKSSLYEVVREYSLISSRNFLSAPSILSRFLQILVRYKCVPCPDAIRSLAVSRDLSEMSFI
jgi:hypothetical protein